MNETSTRRHPLAPLLSEEIERACSIVKLGLESDSSVRFVACAISEPDKSLLVDNPPIALPRLVECVVYSRAKRTTTILVVSLDLGEVISERALEGAQPPILDEEWGSQRSAILDDTRFREALARRGVTDLESVVIDDWPSGYFGSEVDESGRRTGRAVAQILENVGDNPYARPVENLYAVFDRDSGEILEVHDGAPVPIPKDPGRFDKGGAGDLQKLAPLDIVQSEGAGFTVDDGAIRWGPWRLRVTLHPIEGLVLHQVRFVDSQRERDVLHRASLAEMVVPYGSSSMNHWWKNTFDAGEGALGKNVGSLELGCDCLGEIVYLDAAFCTEDGKPYVVRNSICLHEEDYGVLWKHLDRRARRSEVRRSRRLVVSSFITIGNYDYGFFWYLYLDGRIQCEIKLTGIVQTMATRPGEKVPHANALTPELAGVHHQHMFSFRLDICVDGIANSVYEVDAVGEPVGGDNPYGNTFVARTTRLERESDAQRVASSETGRYWKITNDRSFNHNGDPVAYKLMLHNPGPTLLAHPSSSIAKRAVFATKHLWVTKHDEAERRSAGEFPYQHPGGDGLPRWTSQDRSLIETDLVLWPTVGVTHFCRPEDFPVMPVAYAGFELIPFGFFDRNPALNVDQATATGGSCDC